MRTDRLRSRYGPNACSFEGGERGTAPPTCAIAEMSLGWWCDAYVAISVWVCGKMCSSGTRTLGSFRMLLFPSSAGPWRTAAILSLILTCPPTTYLSRLEVAHSGASMRRRQNMRLFCAGFPLSVSLEPPFGRGPARTWEIRLKGRFIAPSPKGSLSRSSRVNMRRGQGCSWQIQAAVFDLAAAG